MLARRLRLLPGSLQRALCAAETGEGAARPAPRPQPPLEPALLGILVCPLSKKPLRYEESTNELINEELGIAYPVVDGIPNMIPQAARMMGKEKQEKDSEQT
ncbi:protein preY, mitochondrial [Tiliqua scincoides]|uniref:protein preY, mitochondrial n=1 Tax=Tiliqua scincoides TaxID=71010 RepID=UPI003463248D